MSKSDASPLQAFKSEFASLKDDGRTADAVQLALGQPDALSMQPGEAGVLSCDAADSLNEQGDAQGAEELYRRGFDSALKTNDLATQARAATGLALLMDHQGRFSEAQAQYERALAAAERLPEPNLRHIATLTNNLAIVCKDLGRFEEAERLYLKAIQIYKDMHKRSHPDLASAMNNLAVFYLQRGDLQNAEAMNIKALIMRQKECRPTDPDIAQSYSNLAAVYHMRGWLDKAETFYQKALAAFAHCKYPPDEERETTIRNYITLLRMIENDDLADKLERRLEGLE